MLITRASGFPLVNRVASSAQTGITLSVTAQAIGDIMIAGGYVQAGVGVTQAVSGGGVTTWSTPTVSRNAALGYNVWESWGVVTSTGPQTITVTLSGGTTSGNGLEVVADELTFPGETSWSNETVTAGNGATGSSTAVAFPSLTATGLGVAEAYWGYAYVDGTGSGGVDSYTYTVNPSTTLIVFGAPAAGTVAPVGAQTPSAGYDAVAVILAVTAPASPAVLEPAKDFASASRFGPF